MNPELNCFGALAAPDAPAGARGSKNELVDKPGSVEDDHSSATGVTTGL
jgi:hypothetical protein